MTFNSEYFETVDDLVRAKDDAWRGVKDKRARRDEVRNFTNMLNTMSDGDAERLGRTEIVNHGLTHRDMLQNETQFTSMVTVTKSLLEVIVDTDNPEQDLIMGQRVSEAINRYAIHRKGKFSNFWRKVAGELVITGGCPVTLPEKYGWLPKLRTDMFFPKETELDAEEVTFAFDPKEMSIVDLKRLSASVKGDNSKYIDKENIDALVAAIEEQIANNTKVSGGAYSQEISHSTRDSDNMRRLVTIPTWWYYEIKYTEEGEQYVSATLFIDGLNGIVLKDTTQTAAKIVAYFDKAFENASDWLHMVCVDSEIGGVKNMDTLKGVAEMVYPSGVEMEDLLNLTMEGDKIRAKPKVRVLDSADPDVVAKWNIYEDLLAPPGVEEMEFKGTSGKLLTPFSMLSANAAGMSGGAVSNSSGGGELRQQAVERQQNSAMLQTNRVSEAYNHLDSILETVVWRLLAGPIKPGTDGYRETMCVRAHLKKYDIDGSKLAERQYGQFKNIRVRARRSIGNGDRVQQLETADWLMSNIQNYEPIARPLVIHQATMLRTQDPDLTDALIKIPKGLTNAQKITAENEFDTIKRRAALGQTLPVAQDDIHQDHIPVHLVDMQAHIATHSARPWDKLDVIAFAGETEHVGEHIKILMGNPITAPEAKVFIQDYQQITQAAQAVIAEVENAQGNDQQQQLTPKEQADVQLKAEGLRLEAMKLGINHEEMQRSNSSRLTKEALAKRTQYTKEINEDRRLKLDAERISVQAAAQKAKPENKNK